MLRSLLLVSVHLSLLHGSPVRPPSSHPRDQRGFLGCVVVNNWTFRDLDPVTCCLHGPQNGTATFLNGSVESFQEPFLLNVSVSTDRMNAAENVLEVCGNLSGFSDSLSEVTVYSCESKPASVLYLLLKPNPDHPEDLKTTCLINCSEATLSLVEDSSVGERKLPAGESTEDGVSSKNIQVCVEEEGERNSEFKVMTTMQPFTTQRPAQDVVRILSERQAYATNTNVTFYASTDLTDPKEFLWHFGDTRSSRSENGLISTRYQIPGRYDASVQVTAGRTSFISQVSPVVVQTPVRLNKLVHRASVLRNQTTTVVCRVNSGTDPVYTWRFGDGTVKSGGKTEQHIFQRVGEFTVDVNVSNSVSSASLSSQIFVVDEPCQPPSLKNMGPLKIQVRRFEVTHLGVTFDADLDCERTEGLSYSWQLLDSAGRPVPLARTDTRQQSLTLPSFLLQCDTYTAVARVEVIGSVVYSNYSVKLEVVPSAPVASVRGPTNLLVNKWSHMVVLDGRESHDPDDPGIPVSFTWTCEPVSSIKTSCFHHRVDASSSRLRFHVTDLKRNFDQFRVTLTVHSGRRWSSSEVFVTLTPHLVRDVTIQCPQCQGDQVIWDQAFTVVSECLDCEASADDVHYTWDLYTVNASTKPVFEVPFCYLAHLGDPSHLTEGSDTVLTPGSPAPPTAESSLHTGNTIAAQEELKNTEFQEDESLFEHSEDVGYFHFEAESSTDWNFDYAAAESVDIVEEEDYDVSDPVEGEGDPGKSPGRPMGVDGEILVPGDDVEFTPVSHDSEGSNLVDSTRAVVSQEPTLLDLTRVPVNKQLFKSFTDSGNSSSSLGFRAFSLQPSSRFMLQVTAASSAGLIGRAQMFFRTKPAPSGMTCQVQPTIGIELFTQFSIFCTSGRADLVYEYSYSVGVTHRRVIYRGADFQYYFHLPAGHPTNDYQVTVNTKIRSSLFGTATKVCPVIVKVLPSFVRGFSSADPESELSILGMRNLTALVELGNKAEIRNYVSLLSNILNRHSPDRHNISTQRRLRSFLVCTLCQMEAHDQASMLDSINILEELFHTSRQVTMLSVKRVTAHIERVSLLLSGPSPFNLDRQMLRSLLSLLSYGLQATLAHQTPRRVAQDVTLDTLVLKEKAVLHDCTIFPSHVLIKSKKEVVSDILQAASDLILKYISLLQSREQSFTTTGGMFFYAVHLNRSSSSLSSRSCSLHMPESLTRLLADREPCVVGLITELTHSPYTNPPEMRAPVIDLSLYKCRTRRKIPVRALFEPIVVEVVQPTTEKETCLFELQRGNINYHSFNISEKHLQHSIQLRLRFSPATSKPFPIMLLFRMYEQPTPSMHHLQKPYDWKSKSTYITFPPSYLNAAGIGHLALLNADFERPLRNRHLSRRINYSLEVVTSQCLSWDEPQGVWSHLGCWTHQTDASASVNCSCHLLRPLSVAQEQIQTVHEAAKLDISVSSDLTIVSVLVVVVCLSVPVLFACRRDDLLSKDEKRVHYLPDNSSWDSHLYAVTVHTGLCSAARMSAKVYIVLYGEDGVSQTRELQVPGRTLFRSNSQDTFILSSSDHLGPVHGLHIWHDNSGHSPCWYIKMVEVAEVNRLYVKKHTWLFVGQCWLAVHKGDGQVQRTLRRTCGVSRAQMFRLKLPDYLSEYHVWMSVSSCPRPTSFMRTHRLGLCLLQLLAYAAANTVMISLMDEPRLLDLAFVGVSLVAVRTGFLSVMAALPLAMLIHVFLRRSTVDNKHDSPDNSGTSGPTKDAHHAWFNLQTQDSSTCSGSLENIFKDDGENEPIEKKEKTSLQNFGSRTDAIKVDQSSLSGSIGFQKSHLFTDGTDDAWKKTEHGDNRSESDIIRDFPVCKTFKEKKKDSTSGFHCLAWTLCLLLSLLCLLLSAVLGLSFSSSKILLWIHSLFFSLLFCVFFFQPALVLAMTTTVCFSNKQKLSGITELDDVSVMRVHRLNSSQIQDGSTTFEKLLRARRRARYLQLVRPPPRADLRAVCATKKRETCVRNTLRDLCAYVALLLVVMNSSGSSFSDQQRLHKVIRQRFTWDKDDSRVQTDAEWWDWTQNQLLDIMYNNNNSNEAQNHILIGEPLLQKSEISKSFQCQVLRMTLGLPNPNDCDQSATVDLGHTKSEAAHKLKELSSTGWLRKETLTVKVQFTWFSPAPNVFTTVTFAAEHELTGVLLPPAKVQSVQLHHSPGYIVMVCQLLFTLLSLLHLWLQIYEAGQQGLIRYCKSPNKWLQLILLPVTILYVVQSVDHSSLLVEVVDVLQRHKYRKHVDISQLANREQDIQSLRGVLVFLLVVKCVTVVKVNKTAASRGNLTRSRLLLSAISCFVLLMAIGFIRSLLRPDQNLWISGYTFLRYRALSLSSAVLLSTVISASTLKPEKKPGNRTELCTFSELVGFVEHTALRLAGRAPQTDVEVKTYYLEEFDCLLDELLYRLNSFYYTLPVPSLSPEPVSVDSQSWTETTLLGDHIGHQQLGLNEMSTDDDNALILGKRLNLLRHEDRDTQDSVSPQSWEQNDRLSDTSQNCSSHRREYKQDDRLKIQSVGNILVEVLVHQQPHTLT